MTIYNLAANTKSLFVTQENNIPPLPNDVWDCILAIFAQNASLVEIAQTSRTCKFFLKHFFENCSFFHIRHSLYVHHFLSQVKGIPRHASSTLTEFKTGVHQFLAQGLDGRQYFCPKAQWEKGTLYILNFSSKKSDFHFVELKLEEALKGFGLNTKGSDFIITACHPTKDGFVLVTESHATLWKYENDRPVFKNFITPDSWRNKDFIWGSLLQKNTLILHQAYAIDKADQGKQIEHTWSLFDIEQNNSEKTITFETSGFPHLICNGDGLSLITDKQHPNEVAKLEIHKVHVDGEYHLQSDAFIQLEDLSFGHFDQTSEDWLVLTSDHKYIHIVDLKKNTLAIGEEMQIVNPFHAETNRTNSIFLKDGFLFLFYPDLKFRVIFLPTKTEYTDQIAPFLKPHLKKDLRIYSIHFGRDKDKGAYLTIFFQKNDESVLATKTEIIQSNFYLERVQESNPPLPKTKQIEATSPNSTYAKITVVAGIAFLLIGVAGYFVLRQHLAGSILYQGHGISLRAQDAALIVGGLLSLPLLAIGSYKWWKASQRN